MKLNFFSSLNYDFIVFLLSEGRRRKYPLWLFLGLCANLIVAPAVLAASDGNIDRTNAYAIGLLGIVTLALAVYLFAVILQPERF
ncbi:MAG: K(+)-transporting ATPase subunit F [Hydrococcus sp. RM1_1_31]|nr:K(+)-transporting ATPase subunit F [Hydrococcus sp. RM1_1_31]